MAPPICFPHLKSTPGGISNKHTLVGTLNSRMSKPKEGVGIAGREPHHVEVAVLGPVPPVLNVDKLTATLKAAQQLEVEPDAEGDISDSHLSVVNQLCPAYGRAVLLQGEGTSQYSR